MKAKLEFDLLDPMESAEFRDAVNGSRYKLALDDVWNKCFRPLYKHGYDNEHINIDEHYEAINAIAELFSEVMGDLKNDISE